MREILLVVGELWWGISGSSVFILPSHPQEILHTLP